jgi:hypothetical protein
VLFGPGVGQQMRHVGRVDGQLHQHVGQVCPRGSTRVRTSATCWINSRPGRPGPTCPTCSPMLGTWADSPPSRDHPGRPGRRTTTGVRSAGYEDKSATGRHAVSRQPYPSNHQRDATENVLGVVKSCCPAVSMWPGRAGAVSVVLVLLTGSPRRVRGDEKGSRCESGAGPLLYSVRVPGTPRHCDARHGKAARNSLRAVSQKTCLSNAVRCLGPRRPDRQAVPSAFVRTPCPSAPGHPQAPFRPSRREGVDLCFPRSRLPAARPVARLR